MSRSGIGLIGVLAYVAALTVTAPAVLFDSRLSTASGGRLRLAATEGTLWNGRGRVELIDASGRAGIDRSVAWHSRPWTLFFGQVDLDVRMEGAAKEFSVSLSPAGVTVARPDFAVPASAMGLVFPKLAPFEPGGEVFLHVDELRFSNGAAGGSAVLQWRAATSALTGRVSLGDYEIRFDETAEPRTVLHTLNGPLRIDGKEILDTDGRRAFHTVLEVSGNLRESLAPRLRLVAAERGDGGFELWFR